ncbi:MFS transporter [Pseudomonas savastanoi]|uniref:MFS transporter n=1 Tax=Pseudomonas savastanoi pv. savastanoi NCPPB 3335 TaxID=693985 RepID=A0ABC8BF79_PSESS|nr:MFS transporter [Pseudomonas savastanoi]ARD12719.1 MFS transporter [Pseudomonas savastanoi pv. savastanoi NCPPB 3335]MBA4706226.1 MFS transporter [Pseudomonas savastanoi pv. savastanoi]
MASHADRRNTLSLDSLNFFLADVRDGLGPYLAIYLLAVHKWDPASIGVVMTIAGIAGLLTQTPAGALIDRTPYKRAMIGVAALLVTLSCLILPFTSSFSVVALTQALSSIASSVFAPAIAAISLGITGPKAFTRRTGRNETFNHAGNACAALLAGGFAYLFGPIAVFYLMAAMALASVIAISFVSADAIDHNVARGFDANHNAHGAQPSGLATLLSNKPLLLAGFLILPIRGVLYTLSDDPYWLVAVQMLDGIGAGLFGALFPLMVKDLTQGSGRFNVSLGALSTLFGLGAALSNGLAGFVVHAAGYSAAFLTLAGVAAAAFCLLLVAVPETLSRSNNEPDLKPDHAVST